MKAGRKRTFDREQALDKAMRVFWENGYFGTSIAQLAQALAINPPSLYATFGNKEQLYQQVLVFYYQRYITPCYNLLDTEQDADPKLQLMSHLQALIELFTAGDTPTGCLFIKSINEAENAAFPADVLLQLEQIGKEIFQTIAMFIERKLKPTQGAKQVELLTNSLLIVSNGIAVQARAGQSKEALENVAQHCVKQLMAS
ncbi:TetR/AcrR family transcriptional regulator [Shewanella sp. WXL01]|uniref:TetR/AcrR family transcriptional regulator n=1 Tax=Shewanella sp. WXL01 TaxID=2709721 RepID=UPI0014383EB5|nr:TetR/AcrR family transcriptional regulator [Shewanella sp. WXL01]NKF48989.1 TetR/AcrR family transcriptional regulator [Shewanella sp. WXL01]